MTNERASATDTGLLVEKTKPEQTKDARPIEDWENRAVKGHALMAASLFADHMAKVAELRGQQEAYEASLPKEPLDALADINRTIKDVTDLDSPEYAARAALEIVNQLATYAALDNSDNLKDALFWLSDRGLKGMDGIEAAAARVRQTAYQFSPFHREFRA